LSPCLLFALAYAILDELHQELVPGRGFELADIGYDMLGMVAALGVMWITEGGRRKGDDGRERGAREHGRVHLCTPVGTSAQEGEHKGKSKRKRHSG